MNSKSETQHITVDPTSAPGSSFSDTSIVLMYSCHMQLLNSERQVIWTRTSAMIIANSVFIGSNTIHAADKYFNMISGIFGIALCIVWGITNHIGWSYYTELVAGAERFKMNKDNIDISVILDRAAVKNKTELSKSSMLKMVYFMIFISQNMIIQAM